MNVAARARVSGPPRYVAAQWPDPDDKNPLRRTPVQVKGLVTYSAIRALHKRTPRDITAEMVDAATRLACDVEAAGCGFAMVASYGHEGGRAGVWAGKPADRAVDAVARVRAAERALAGVDDVVAWVVIGNRTVKSWAAADFGPECFTPATLKSAARDFKFFPAYAELAAHLRHFQRDETPRIGYEIPQPRRAPTAEEVEHVAATLRAFQAERSFFKPASAPAKAVVKPAYLSPGTLLAAYEAQKQAGVTGLDARIAGLRRQIGLDSGAAVGAVLSDPRGVMAGVE